MGTFSVLLALCMRNSPVTGVNSTHKGQCCEALMFSLICAWINGWVNNREAGNLRSHHAHYDVTVMVWRKIQNNTMLSCSFWFYQTQVNIEWILVTWPQTLWHILNFSILTTESRPWGTSWCYLFSGAVYKLCCGTFRIFSAKVFNWTIEGCFPSSSSKGEVKNCFQGTYTLSFFHTNMIWGLHFRILKNGISDIGKAIDLAILENQIDLLIWENLEDLPILEQ